MNKTVYGVEILNKSVDLKQNYYLKLLNTLHDVYIHLGYTPDPQFYGALQFSKAKTPEEIEEVVKLNQFEENRISAYSELLVNTISKSLDKVSIEDLVNMTLFIKEYPGTDEMFDNIVYKSECKNCKVDEVKEKPRVFRNKLGQYMIDED